MHLSICTNMDQQVFEPLIYFDVLLLLFIFMVTGKSVEIKFQELIHKIFNCWQEMYNRKISNR